MNLVCADMERISYPQLECVHNVFQNEFESSCIITTHDVTHHTFYAAVNSGDIGRIFYTPENLYNSYCSEVPDVGALRFLFKPLLDPYALPQYWNLSPQLGNEFDLGSVKLTRQGRDNLSKLSARVHTFNEAHGNIELTILIDILISQFLISGLNKEVAASGLFYVSSSHDDDTVENNFCLLVDYLGEEKNAGVNK